MLLAEVKKQGKPFGLLFKDDSEPVDDVTEGEVAEAAAAEEMP